jgi:hypothetical protein
MFGDLKLQCPFLKIKAMYMPSSKEHFPEKPLI